MHIALEWIGKPYDVGHFDFAAMKSPEYMQMNPSGVIPTLPDGDLVLPEGLATLLHLVDRAHPATAAVFRLVGKAEQRTILAARSWLSNPGRLSQLSTATELCTRAAAQEFTAGFGVSLSA